MFRIDKFDIEVADGFSCGPCCRSEFSCGTGTQLAMHSMSAAMPASGPAPEVPMQDDVLRGLQTTVSRPAHPHQRDGFGLLRSACLFPTHLLSSMASGQDKSCLLHLFILRIQTPFRVSESECHGRISCIAQSVACSVNRCWAPLACLSGEGLLSVIRLQFFMASITAPCCPQCGSLQVAANLNYSGRQEMLPLTKSIVP